MHSVGIQGALAIKRQRKRRDEQKRAKERRYSIQSSESGDTLHSPHGSTRRHRVIISISNELFPFSNNYVNSFTERTTWQWAHNVGYKGTQEPLFIYYNESDNAKNGWQFINWILAGVDKTKSCFLSQLPTLSFVLIFRSSPVLECFTSEWYLLYLARFSLEQGFYLMICRLSIYSVRLSLN